MGLLRPGALPPDDEPLPPHVRGRLIRHGAVTGGAAGLAVSALAGYLAQSPVRGATIGMAAGAAAGATALVFGIFSEQARRFQAALDRATEPVPGKSVSHRNSHPVMPAAKSIRGETL